MSRNFPLEEITAALASGHRAVDIAGVDIDVAAYLAVALHAETKRTIVALAPGASETRRVAADLRFFAGESRVVHLPEVENSPYADLSPERGAVLELLGQLSRLAWEDHSEFIVASSETIARRVIPSEIIVERSYLVARNSPLDRGKCLRALADGGYHAVGTVEDPGTFAVRGGIIDVFAPHLDDPIRIELWGDEVESIRRFNPETQRTFASDDPRALELEEMAFPPVREELLVQPYIDRARRGILDAAGRSAYPTRKLQPILGDLVNGIPFMGIEGFRPAFYPSLDTLFDYLPDDAVYLVLDPMGSGDRWRNSWNSRTAEYEEAIAEPRPALPPGDHYLSPAELMAALDARAQVRAHVVQMDDELGAYDAGAEAIRFNVPSNRDLVHALEQARGDREPLEPLADALRTWASEGARVAIACRQTTQMDRLERTVKGFGLPVLRGEAPPRTYLVPPDAGEVPNVVLLPGLVGGGFRLVEHGFALVTEEEIFGRKTRRARAKQHADTSSPFVQNFRDLELGDHVVHVDHGVGRYLGLQKLTLAGIENDFLLVEFASKDKLYLPVHKLGRVQKYVGSNASPKINKLGGTAWERVRGRAQESAEEDAYALLELYAKRELASGYAYETPDEYFHSFEATFPFEETPDQARAIDEVMHDMTSPQPMDRLLCGDVGYGKTEVAIRAAMRAVLDAKQVAVLVPTTVLSLQHHKTMKARFASYPVRVELLSRLVTKEDQKAVLTDLKTGKIDIIIGTHRLLSKDIKFSDLGLLILDEEHRFGVRHKERIKEVRTNVDVLAMTATPIPRTLQLSLGGVRDMSVITTPPADRLSVRTFVCRATDQVVRDATLRELGRGGQIYFIHNRVQTIDARRAWLQSLVPEARITVAHGQMDPRKLEKVMVDFTEGRHNILLCTTIIESGIDIANANTMLIDHADRLGLAQLYQLRGRVGRSRERGYCYLLVPGQAALSGDARQRLSVIQKFTELGSGFQVASHDLELRGAGELLGTRQKGHVAAVGLDLYAQLLEEAVRKGRGEAPRIDFDPEINLQVNARIPEDFVPDSHVRLVIYKRLANADDEEQVLAVAEEMADRFGAPPGPVDNLIEVMRIRTLGRRIGLNSIDHAGDRCVFAFHPQSPFPVDAVVALVSAPDSRFRASADFKLSYYFTADERRETVGATRIALQHLAEFVTEGAVVDSSASAPASPE